MFLEFLNYIGESINKMRNVIVSNEACSLFSIMK